MSYCVCGPEFETLFHQSGIIGGDIRDYENLVGPVLLI
jgi:hypothetical protein